MFKYPNELPLFKYPNELPPICVQLLDPVSKNKLFILAKDLLAPQRQCSLDRPRSYKNRQQNFIEKFY